MTMDPLAFIIAFSQLAAAIALLNGVNTAIGQGNVVSTTIQAIARQPEVSGSIQSTMFIGLAMAETSGIYGLLIAILLLFANPLIPLYLQYAGG